MSSSVPRDYQVALCFRAYSSVQRDERDSFFTSFVERRFGISTSNFFRGLLFHWGIQAHHLTPNSILYISIFVHLCKAFLGIEPHFDLFKYFFHLKPQPSKKELAVVGGASPKPQGREKFYIPYKLPGKVIDWKDKWFYAENQAPPLPERTSGAPCHCGEWNTDPGSMFQVNE